MINEDVVYIYKYIYAIKMYNYSLILVQINPDNFVCH